MRRGFVDSPDGQIHYVRSDDIGWPVLFLHPSPHAWNYFADVAPLMPEQEFEFVAMDTMGYGDSARPPVPYTAMQDYARAVVHLLDGLNIKKARIVGHLTGAQIAAEVAACFPDRVECLVLSEIFNWDTPERRAVHERLHYRAEPTIDGAHLLRLWNRFAGRAEFLGIERVERLFFNAYRANYGDPTLAYGTMNWDGAAPWAMCRYPLWERAPRIVAPTLILHGQHSDLKKIQAKLTEAITGSKAVLYPSKSMGGPLESPMEWTAAVVDFLREQERSRRY